MSDNGKIAISIYANEVDEHTASVVFDVLLKLGAKFQFSIAEGYDITVDEIDADFENEDEIRIDAEVRVGERAETQIELALDLEKLLNKYSSEKPSGTPDYILARYLIGCLANFDDAVKLRAEWRNEPIDVRFSEAYSDDE